MASNGTEINRGTDTECTFSLLAQGDPAWGDKELLWDPETVPPTPQGWGAADCSSDSSICLSGVPRGPWDTKVAVGRVRGEAGFWRVLCGRRAEDQLSVIQGWWGGGQPP